MISLSLILTSCISLTISPGGSSPRPTPTRDLGAIRVDNNATIRLQAGTYTGRLVINANNAKISGAGIGRTIIRGDVIINGNANRVSGLTIQGGVSISGNTNNLSGVELNKSRVTSRGNNNRY
jgi:formylmethanofuran dehydrogenase subunit C